MSDLRRMLDSGALTSETIVDTYLKRIATIDQAPGGTNAILAVNQGARARAQQLDRDRSTANRGPLYGIPVIVKDNYDVEGMPTTAGSVTLANAYPTKNAPAIQRLVDAGAIILAKANMSELAASYGRLGYSSRGGLTLNPYNEKRNASGSSSGSAAAVAAELAPLALGTDTSGSVRGPASVTGIDGLRPTHGSLSLDGIVPLAGSFDTPGPLAKNIPDLVTLFATLTGQPSIQLTDSALKGARIGRVSEFFGGNAEVDQAADAALQRMKDAGAEVLPIDLGKDITDLWAQILGPVGEIEFAPQMDRYLATLPAGSPKTVDDIITISESPGVVHSANPVNPARIDGYKTAVSKRGQLTSPEYAALQSKMVDLRARIADVMTKNSLSVLSFPTMSCVASPRFDQADTTYQCNADDPYAASYLASATGMPEVTTPVGQDREKLPIGISFLGRPNDEATLLNVAYSWEKLANLTLHAEL